MEQQWVVYETEQQVEEQPEAICPLPLPSPWNETVSCYRERCAWWIGERCAVAVLAESALYPFKAGQQETAPNSWTKWEGN